MSGIILVTGGTGKTGSRVIQRLIAEGISCVSASRSGERIFSWDTPDTWGAALEGVNKIYLTYPDPFAPNGPDQLSQFMVLAKQYGVKKVVYLSGRAKEEAVGPMEDVVINSGIKWTILRPSWFSQNFSEGFNLDSILEGEIILPVGAATEPFIDVNDIADVAVAALTDDRHNECVYELTGPRLLSFHDIASEISAAASIHVAYTPVSSEEYRALLKKSGLPEDMELMFSDLQNGTFSYITNDVEKVLGHPASDFSKYASKAAASGVWKQAN